MKSRYWILVALLAGVASAAPIRVGVFKGTGPGRYWHSAIHTAANAIASILANPDSAGFVDPVVPSEGFSVRMFGPDSAQCAGAGCGPTAAQLAEFVAALDSLDVVVVSNFVDIGGRIVDTGQRARFARFIQTKGLVSNRWSIDSYGSWAAWDTLHVTRASSQTTSSRMGTLHHDSAAATDPAWRFLNRGLPDTARFTDVWISFTTNADFIRGKAGLKVTLKLDEASLAGGLGGARAMGDHPYSWYREFPEGGRLFYTGIGWRAQLYTGSGSTADAYYLRRQLYNAILWAAGVDSSGTVVAVRGTKSPGQFSDAARVGWSGGSLRVTMLGEGAHSVEIRTLEGRLVASRRGTGRMEHRFDRPSSGSMLVVTVKTDAGRVTKLVAAP